MKKNAHGCSAYQSDLLARISWRVRNRMFRHFLETFAPTETTKVLDVGVMGNAIPDEIEANYFEQLYPYPKMLTGLTQEDPSQLRQQFPQCTFTQGDGRKLPFDDQSFDVVFSAAVIEHVGSREKQRAFVREACRVGKNVFITTPNRFFPIEPHCYLPFINYFPPPVFRAILRRLGLHDLAKEEKLNLLTAKEFVQLFDSIAQPRLVRVRLCLLTQNLIAIVQRS
jgi:SAM-dependent methyltransferase